MKPTPVQTDAAPGAIGPYSQAIVCGEMVYCSGQVGLVPGSADLVGPDVEGQTSQALRNLAGVLAAAGSGLDLVVQTAVFLIDMGDFAAMNAVYAQHFGDWKPARATVAVSGLPKGARVEISAVAAVRR